MATYKLKTPISEEEIRKLSVNDVLYVSGTMVTARDQAHRRALEHFKQGKMLPVNLEGSGPTTSTRMDIFEDEFIKDFKVRVIIGKGGMGRRTTEAMAKYGAVYGAFTGGAAVLAAKAVKKVRNVEWYDLGMPEAMWVLDVEEFGPLSIAIDSHGNNLFEDIKRKAEENRQRIYRKLGISI
jgi:fumarate hydratase subunit beta